MGKKKSAPSSAETARRNERRAVLFVGYIRQPIKVRFGSAVRKQRETLGLTQAQLSEMTGMSRSYISEVECGRENISLERAERLASALNCTLADLVEE